jgi:hypothetical protein
MKPHAVSRRRKPTIFPSSNARRAVRQTMPTWNAARAEYARSVFLVRAAIAEGGNP